MEDALKFLRFWIPTTVPTIMPSTIPDPIMVVDYLSDDEEDDSFFDLEITSDFDNKENTNYNTKHSILEASSEKDAKRLKNQKHPSILQPKLTPNEIVSRRKILPIEPSSSKPQSPIALLKSAQTLKVFKFKKPREMAPKSMETTEMAKENKEKRSLYVKFMLDDDDETKMSKFTSQNSVDARSKTSSSKRFELVHRYLNMLKPLFDKVSSKRMQNEKVRDAMASPVKMRQGNGPKIACKSKSSPGASVVPTLPAVRRRDDSLLQQLDGIQGAILHCKRSFNSSTDSSMDLSRKSAEEMTNDVSI